MSGEVRGYTTGRVEDIMVVPVSISYEKLIEGNFISEQLVSSPECRFRALLIILSILSMASSALSPCTASRCKSNNNNNFIS